MLAIGNEGRIIGFGFGLVLQGLLKCKSLENIEITVKAQVRLLCPLTFIFATCAVPGTAPYFVSCMGLYLQCTSLSAATLQNDTLE